MSIHQDLEVDFIRFFAGYTTFIIVLLLSAVIFQIGSTFGGGKK